MQLFGLQGLWQHQVCRDTDCLRCRSYGPIRVFFWASCSWWSEGLFGQSFSVALPIQVLRGLSCLGSFSAVWRIRHIEGPAAAVLLCRLVHQSLKGAPWAGSYSVVQCVRRLMGQPLHCWAANAGMWGGERLWCWLHPLHVTQQYRLAFMATWLSSTGISHYNLFPHIPMICLSEVSSSPHPGIAPQSLNSSFQPLRPLGNVWLWQGPSDSHSI